MILDTRIKKLNPNADDEKKNAEKKRRRLLDTSGKFILHDVCVDPKFLHFRRKVTASQR